MRAPNKQKRRGQEVGKATQSACDKGRHERRYDAREQKAGRKGRRRMNVCAGPKTEQHARVDTRSLSACQSKATTKGEKGSRGREDRGRRGGGRGGESIAERGERGRSNDDGRAKKKNTKAPRTQPAKSARRERNMKPWIGASGASGSTARAPGLDRRGVSPVARTGASEATGRIRKDDTPDWSYRGGMKHNISPWNGLSSSEPGATDWSVRGGRESTTKRPPGLEQPGRNEARR